MTYWNFSFVMTCCDESEITTTQKKVRYFLDKEHSTLLFNGFDHSTGAIIHIKILFKYNEKNRIIYFHHLLYSLIFIY